MLAISKLVGGEIADAGQFGLQLLTQAQKETNLVAEVEAHYVLGVTYHWQGRFTEAREHLRKAIDRYDRQNHHFHITDYAQDPSVICRIRLAMVLWHLGFPDQALQTGRDALELARQLHHPFSRSYALHWFAWLQNLRDDPAATLEHARTSITFSEEYHFPYFATQSGILCGWAMFRLGEEDEGMQKMREGLSRFRATGSEIGCAYYRALIAGALAENGSFAQSLPLLDEAMTSMAGTDEHWSEAAILIMKGTVLRRNTGGEGHAIAEEAYRAAITVAREQGAKTDALRAALNLQHLLQALDRCEEASTVYQEIKQWVESGMAEPERMALDRQIERWVERLN
jgi:predicted ATPase